MDEETELLRDFLDGQRNHVLGILEGLSDEQLRRPVLRGRRFGNLVVVASDRELPVSRLIRRIAADPFPARLVEGAALGQWVAGCAPIVDAHAEPSPAMPPEVFA